VRLPLPEGTPPGRGAKPGEKGQAAFVPTDEQRQRVMHLLSCYFTLDRISVTMGIPERTLSRHFAEELATGKLRVHAEIAAGIVEGALNGDKAMMILYAKGLIGWRKHTSVGLEATRGQAMNPRQVFHLQISHSATGEDQH
jgi:hypothetical protein